MGRMEEYLGYCQKYEKLYGVEKTVVLYQNGKFYELYGVDNEQEKLGKVTEMATLLRIQETRVNSKILENSRKNPQMAGFNCISIDRYLDVLMEHGYTVVVVDQLTPPPNVERGVTAVWSQGTYINDLGRQDHYLVSIYIESEPHKKSDRSYDHIGLTAINLATGKSLIHEVASSPADPTRAMDETYRFLQTLQPVEVLINSRGYGKKEKTDKTDKTEHTTSVEHTELLERLDLGQVHTHVKLNEVPAQIFDPSYQSHYLHGLFPDHGHFTVLDYLSLTTRQTATVSYILLLLFCADHKESLLRHLKEPELWTARDSLILDHNAICQLNINETGYRLSGTKLNSKMHSISRLVDNTLTGMGRRLLQERLLNPLIDPVKIRERYDYVDYMLTLTEAPEEKTLVRSSKKVEKLPWWRLLCSYLKHIKDIERLHRRIQLGFLTPAELATLYDSYLQIQEIIKLSSVDKKGMLRKLLPEETVRSFDLFCQYLREIVDMNEAKKYTTTDIDDSFFMLGYDEEIDRISGDIKEAGRIIDIAVDTLSDQIKKGSEAIKYKPSCTDDGYYLDISKPRFKLLEMALKSRKDTLTISVDGQDYQLDRWADLVIDTRNKSNVKITSPFIDKFHYGKDHNIKKLRIVVKTVYARLLENIGKEYIHCLDRVTDSLAQIDVYASSAKIASQYHYCRPEVLSDEEHTSNTENRPISNFRAVGLRHPIIEQLVRTNYVSHDISLGQEFDGILLYGINQSGKSSTMKAIGVAIVMAQSGLFVPAQEFSYVPYHTVMTRILGNDKMHGGLSSFAVEMSELRSILIRSDSRTLVLGDEICHGTETQSALSLVTASVMELAKRRCTFIFATHLHQLSDMSEIKSLERVKQYHLTMYRDPVSGDIIYDRQLREGSGCAIYGLEVARALKIPDQVLEVATSIRKKYFGTGIEPIKSSYNVNVYQDVCQICQEEGRCIKATETHHIRFQSEADPQGFIGKEAQHKNHASNLVPLCHEHHSLIHNGIPAIYTKGSSGSRESKGKTGQELIIIGYKQDGHLEYYIRPKLESLTKPQICLPLGSKNQQKPLICKK